MIEGLKDPFSLEGKNILITGASSGIGKAIAQMAAGFGAHLIITGRDEKRLEETLNSLKGDSHLYYTADLSIENNLSELVQKLPKLDGVVLCAGANLTLPLQFLTRKKIDLLFEVNFYSQAELLRLLLKKKLLVEKSSVVAISSIGGNEAFTPGAAAYGASKAALLSWMRSSAKELAPKIRINCICPGQVNTKMNNDGAITTEQYENYRKSIPMKRFAEPEEIAPAAIYFLSEASSWVTGSQLIIDGGTTL